MYYSLDLYDKRRCAWDNWTESGDYNYIKDLWHKSIEAGHVARVRKVEDITSGVRWID